jgi:ribonuclease HI
MPSRKSAPSKSNLFGSQSALQIWTDGGARGNPGPAALGVVIGEKEYGEYLGPRTNNYAEYSAILFALKKAKQLLGKTKARATVVEVRMDSELAVKQLNHEYKINDAAIQHMFLEIWNLMLDFKAVTFQHVRRTENKRADAVVNRVLDAQVI